MQGCQIVIANRNKQRGLGDSEYNERRGECEQGLAGLQKGVGAAYQVKIGCVLSFYAVADGVKKLA